MHQCIYILPQTRRASPRLERLAEVGTNLCFSVLPGPLITGGYPYAIGIRVLRGLFKGQSLGPPVERIEQGYPFFHVVYFSRGTLPPQKVGKRALLGDLAETNKPVLKGHARFGASISVAFCCSAKF